MFDTDVWLEALEARQQSLITAGSSVRLTNLMRWQLERQWTTSPPGSFELPTHRAPNLRHDFATDHPVATRSCGRSTRRHEGTATPSGAGARRRKQAREEKDGRTGCSTWRSVRPAPAGYTVSVHDTAHTTLPTLRRLGTALTRRLGHALGTDTAIAGQPRQPDQKRTARHRFPLVTGRFKGCG